MLEKHNVNEELRAKGLSEEAIARLQPIIMLSGSNREKLAVLKEQLATSEIAVKGIEEMTFILDRIDQLPMHSELELDLTLARGLNYYTGAIFEVKALDVQIGSIPCQARGRKGAYLYQNFAISSSTVTGVCSPVIIFFRLILPSLISVSPTIATYGIFFVSAYPICFFILADSGKSSK